MKVAGNDLLRHTLTRLASLQYRYRESEMYL
jgi:hypothetical protein